MESERHALLFKTKDGDVSRQMPCLFVRATEMKDEEESLPYAKDITFGKPAKSQISSI